MKFACESCQAQYMISDEKVGPRGVKVRCKKCNHVNVVRRPAPATDPDVVAAAAPAPARRSGNLDEELGAAFESVVGGAPVPAAGTAPARLPAEQEEQDDPFAGGFDDGGGLPDHERTQFIPAADLQRAFASHEQEPAPAPAPVTTEWYVAIDDEQVGPLRFEEVRARWEKAEIGPDTLCWRTGMADWAPLAQVSELADALAPLKVPTAAPAAGDASWLKAAMTPAEAPAAPGWKPSAASALASLVEAELEASKKAEAAPEATLERDLPGGGESTGIRTLLKNLPAVEAPAPEMSRLLPLGVETRPAAAPAAAAPAAAPAPAPAPVAVASAPAPVAAEKKGGAGKWIAAAAAAVVLVAGGAFAGGLLGKSSAPAPAPAPAPVAAAPAPAPAPAPPPAPAPAAATAEAQPAEGADASAGQGGAAAPAAAVAAAADPVDETAKKVADEAESRAKALAATPAEEPEEEPKVAAAPKKQAPKRPQPARATRRPEPKPATAPAPASSSGGDLLAAAGNTSSIDSLFASEFRKPAPAPAPASSGGTYIPPAPGSGGKPHQLSQGDIAGVVVGHKAALKSCATNYKAKSGLDSGTVVMRWTILPNGATTGVQPIKGAEHKELATCIGNLVKGWKFPAYSGPQMAPIDFPFQF